MKATMKKIQAHIDEKYGNGKYEFVKGNGYFYFVPGEGIMVWPESLYVFALHQMPLEKWIRFVEIHIDEAIHLEGGSDEG